MENQEKIISYKGFEPDWKCRDFQYEFGKEYVHEGEVQACEEGFHGCEYPLDVFKYYPPASSVFAIVEQTGEISRDGDDSKVASSEIKINAELTLAGIIKAAIEYTTRRAKPVKWSSARKDQSAASATGDNSASSATGDNSASSATGHRSASTATGYSSASSATGYRSASSATGDSSASIVTGYSSASSATGYRSASSATGDNSASTATGYSSASTATGDSSASSATGDSSASSATGYSSASTATGYRSASTATGDRSASTATGHSSASLVTGSFSSSKIISDKNVKNLNAVAIATGYKSRAMAPPGSALFLAERNDDGKILAVWAGIVGKDGINPDVFYTLKNGKPVEAA